MILGLAVVLAVVAGTVLGGRISALADLHIRCSWLIAIAITAQVVAFPSALPWHTSDTLATWLWVGSYALLVLATVVNGHIPGMRFVAIGMGFNLAAILANGGHMPALPEAAAQAGLATGVDNNSETLADPQLAMLVDRWAAPEWVPLANVFSIGDVLLFVGAFALVLPAMGVSLRRLLPARA